MTLAMIAAAFPEGAARNRAFGVWRTTTGISTSVGVLLGGLLTSCPGWRWIFFINVPIAALLLLGARRYLPAGGPTAACAASTSLVQFWSPAAPARRRTPACRRKITPGRRRAR